MECMEGLLSSYVGWEIQEKDGADDGRKQCCIHELLRRRWRRKGGEGQGKKWRMEACAGSQSGRGEGKTTECVREGGMYRDELRGLILGGER